VSVSRSVGRWPAQGLDVKALRARGWHPEPFREFVLKLHSRCNLACDYCYIYESEDRSWKSQPAIIDEPTISQAAARVAEHVERHGLEEIEIVLHGGEPLLAGTKMIDFTVTRFRSEVPRSCRVAFSMQTNGTLLTEKVLDLLGAHDIGVAISLDGDRTAHDLHRRYANGRGSHSRVLKGLKLLAERYRHLYNGILCTVDVTNDPIRVYEALLETAPPEIDFLLPHGTWTVPPPLLRIGKTGQALYADWMITIFDRWYRAPKWETGIRFFEEIMNIVLGGHSRSENIGLSPVAMVVIETDGTLQQVDTLKTSYAGAPETGLTVFDHPFDAALEHPGVVARQIGSDALCAECQGCAVRDTCGGGAYAHRYREETGYRNPSVYCQDLFRLVQHIETVVRAELRGIGEITAASG
jgi:uncharacterized protein